jgi:hypothetical protein
VDDFADFLRWFEFPVWYQKSLLTVSKAMWRVRRLIRRAAL